MTYIQVKWNHSLPTEPVLLYSELDENRWEVRKVELFGDGHRGYASADGTFGGTWLSIEPIPPLAEIAADSQFELAELNCEEFERVWATRQGDDEATTS